MKITRNPEFFATVRVNVPVDGGLREQSFRVRFRALTLSEQQGLLDPSSSDMDGAFLREVVTGWEGLTDEDGSSFEFGPSNLSLLIDLPYIRGSLVRAYFDAINGLPAAKRGN